MDEIDLRERLQEATQDVPARLDAYDAWRAARLRSGRRVVGAVLATGATIVIAVVGVVAVAGDRKEDPPPAEQVSIVPPDASAKQSLEQWGASLPQGAAPEAAYLADTLLHLPNGAKVNLAEVQGVVDAGLIGRTVAGVIVLVEQTDEQGAFGSKYVLVADDGTIRDMPVSSDRGPGAAQDEAISPDGRYFANGSTVIDKNTGETVADVPIGARVIISWTPEGILYGGRDDQYFLWRPGEAPVPVDGYPGWYPNGTDVGIRGTGQGCTDVVRINRAGEVTQLSDTCIRRLIGVSPDGTWALTADLRVFDVATGQSRSLAVPALSEEIGAFDIYWIDDARFLLPVPADGLGGTARVVRCDATQATCEAATGSFDVEDYRTVQIR